MATRKQKQDLISALKFTPRDIEITLSGYGGEIVIGRISEAAYDYWEGRDDLADFVYDWDGEFEDVPADARFVTDGSWYDVDDICHENGCEANEACWITVEDFLEGRTIWETNLDLDNLASQGVDTQNHSHYRPEEDEPAGTCIFMGQSVEKGTFFSGRVRITQPFDPKKLLIHWNDCDGWRLISSVEYDGEDVEGHDAYSTTGKSSEYRVYRVENDNEEWDAKKSLEEISVPRIQWQPEGTNPPTKGEYHVLIDAPWPKGGLGQAEWTGRGWRQDGAKIKVSQWGLPDDPLDIPVLEGEEMWAQEAIDSEPETWEGIPLSPWWSGDEQPVRKGEYEIFETGSNWPFPQRARWNGKDWKVGKEVVSVKSWRGLTQPAD